jgi:hypothetical protein
LWNRIRIGIPPTDSFDRDGREISIGGTVATDYGPDDIAEAIRRLNFAGWSVGSTAFATEAGGLAWVVSGTNGENRIEGRAMTERAWRSPLDAGLAYRDAGAGQSEAGRRRGG